MEREASTELYEDDRSNEVSDLSFQGEKQGYQVFQEYGDLTKLVIWL